MRGLRTAPVICVKVGVSWSAQVFRQAGDTPSGPGADRLPVVDSPECWGMVSCNW